MTGKTTTTDRTVHLNNQPVASHRPLLLVAEGLHVLNPRVIEAITDHNAEELLNLARRHLAGGAQALAVNMGPGRVMAELTPWVTDTLLRELNTPLFLSANALSQSDLLHRHGRQLTINAVTADPAPLSRSLAVAKEHGCDLVVLLVKPGLTPAGSTDRLGIASEVVDQALRVGFPLRQLFLDPLLTLHPDPHAWRISHGFPDLGPVAETIFQLRHLDDGLRTIVALGNFNGSRQNGHEVRFRMLRVLAEAGLDAVILDGRDHHLLRHCLQRGGKDMPETKISLAA